ncbi:PLP-dependent transferase [Polyplosphaeria fusca]|uniref:PLP-dependent transferase n=1 Tax=Polyplosphaeria fusca TaxID=682080 RepID=A0A9P4V805_9PLEO|nr:PLP-dependent transferase [Polyplosphaeria fusca]
MNKSSRKPILEQSLEASLQSRQQRNILRNLTVNNQKIDFSSNDFLSLSKSPLLRDAFHAELSRLDYAVGSTGSRLLDGNSQYAEELEKGIAKFHGAEAGLLFNSGFDANTGFFSCIPQPGDYIVYDELIHASVHEGMRLSRATKCVPFKHNSVSHLRAMLLQCQSESSGLNMGKSSVIIAIESTYSMDGDLAPLKEIVETVEEVLPEGCGLVVIDEAHSTGVLGPQGRGLVSSLGLEKRVFARLHTFGKALACNGAIILGSHLLRLYLINYARPLIYSTFMSFPSLAAIQASYSLLQQGHTEASAIRLQSLTQRLHARLVSAQSPSFLALLRVPHDCPRSPIFAIMAAEPKKLAAFLQSRGMVARAVVPPTVPEGTARVRICLHAGNTEAEIDSLVTEIEVWTQQQTLQVSERGRTEKRLIATARL